MSSQSTRSRWLDAATEKLSPVNRDLVNDSVL